MVSDFASIVFPQLGGWCRLSGFVARGAAVVAGMILAVIEVALLRVHYGQTKGITIRGMFGGISEDSGAGLPLPGGSGRFIEPEPLSEEDVGRNLGFVIKKAGNILRMEERPLLGISIMSFGNHPME